ncbi:MAG: hypothetical protein NTX50_03625 [Candidatus Sumerlaeota bacterium]|nr:hypothetical protein [Candidatus Sumerlaeota bacterium]
MNSTNFPLFIAMGIALAWTACILYGVEQLYRRKSPLYIIYWGSWICFALWYWKYTKDNPPPPMHALIKIIIIIFLVMGVLFGAFSAQKPVRERYKEGQEGPKPKPEE